MIARGIVALAIVGAVSGAKASVAGQWSASVSVDPMTDRAHLVLTLRSRTPIRSGLGATVSPAILIRCGAGQIEDAYIALGGVVDDDRAVTLRFDSRPAVEESWHRSSDYRALFAPDAEGFVDQLEGAKRLLVRLTMFAEAPDIITFIPSGLAVHRAAMRKHCGGMAADRAARRRLTTQQADSAALAMDATKARIHAASRDSTLPWVTSRSSMLTYYRNAASCSMATFIAPASRFFLATEADAAIMKLTRSTESGC